MSWLTDWTKSELISRGIWKENNAGFDESGEWKKDADGNFIVDDLVITAPKKETDKKRNYTAIILISVAAIVAAIIYTRK